MALPKNVFRMPTKMTVGGRSSSLTNAFIATVMPYLKPKDGEVREVLKILGMKEEEVRCAYCGEKNTEWDHLRPFVSDRKPTGFFTSIRNLVPACGKCNQSKGNKDWRKWMLSTHSKDQGFQDRLKRLEAFESWARVVPIEVERVVGKKRWSRYFAKCDAIISAMKAAHFESLEIRRMIRDHYQEKI